MNLTIIGENIKRYRLQSGLNQSQIADFLSLDQSMISKIEKGERKISVDLVEKLANLFCCPVTSLLSEELQPSCNIAFRTNMLEKEDLITLSTINKIVLNQFEMDLFARSGNDD